MAKLTAVLVRVQSRAPLKQDASRGIFLMHENAPLTIRGAGGDWS